MKGRAAVRAVEAAASDLAEVEGAVEVRAVEGADHLAEVAAGGSCGSK
jgi:hypothetical protein